MIVAALLAGCGIGYTYAKSVGVGTVSLSTALSQSKDAYEQGYAAARNELGKQTDASKVTLPPLPAVITSISGTIESTGATSFKIKSPAPGPLQENWVVDREVTVSSSTRFVVLTSKDPEKLREENEAFLAAQEKSPSPDQRPPVPFTEVVITYAELKPGDFVTVFADKNIKSEAAFTATKVVVGAKETPPTLAPPPKESN